MQMEITALYGKSIYTDVGIHIGKINDVSVDIKERRISGLAVKNANREVFYVTKKKGVIIPYR